MYATLCSYNRFGKFRNNMDKAKTHQNVYIKKIFNFTLSERFTKSIKKCTLCNSNVGNYINGLRSKNVYYYNLLCYYCSNITFNESHVITKQVVYNNN